MLDSGTSCNAANIKDYSGALDIAGIAEACKERGAFDALTKAEEGAEIKQPFTGIVKTSCRACITDCSVLAHVENGRVVKLEGNPEDLMTHGRMCAKGLSGMQALYHPNRNKYPLKRVGERGGGKWRRISWDEAIDTLAKKLMETREKYGAETVFCSTGGGGNPEFWSIVRFCNIFETPNWWEPGCAQCYLPRLLAYVMMYGGTDPSIADSNALELYFPDETPIKCIVLWGTDPSYSCPASGGRALVELRARGVKTVVVDPRLTPDAAKATVWLPLRPGTDVALLLAWSRYIMEHKLYDHDFVTKWSNLPYLVDVETKMQWRAEISQNRDLPDTFMVWDTVSNSAKPLAYPWDDAIVPALDGEWTINGKRYKTGFRLLWESVEEYTLEKASKICVLDAERIEKAILTFTENQPCGIVPGVATDQTPNSEEAAMAAVVIDILMGNVEKPGVLMQRFRPNGILNMGYPVPVATKMLPPEQLKKRLGGARYKGLHIWFAGHAPSIQEAVLTGKPYQPRVWIDRSGNKLAAAGESQRWLEVIKKLDFIAHVYMYPTSFSTYADLLFPAEEWLETDMIYMNCNRVAARQAVTHLWETVDETVFWSKLAKRCAELGHENCKKAFDKEFMGEDLAYWDSTEELLDQCVARIGMTWKELKEKTPYEFLPKEKWRTYYVYKQIDPKTGKPQGFNTPSKKTEAYLESMITLGRTGRPFSPIDLDPVEKDYEPLAYYLEPSESPQRDDGIAKEYPLVLTSGRIPFYHHGTLRNIPGLREMYPVPETWINPKDAVKYAIKDGDWVWVESLRGKIRGKAVLTEGIGPGTVFMERFWNPETMNTETHGWKEMNLNVLTKSTPPYNDVVGTYTLRGFLVKVSKADGPPEGVWTKPEDFKTWLPLTVNATRDEGAKNEGKTVYHPS
jgi:anaerobic selenocysteine-containing dehydrogenase